MPTTAPSLPSAGPSLQVPSGPGLDLRETRRLVTVLFADLSGSTALGERLDPEDLRPILASYFGALSRQLQRFGGTVDKYIGDAVMAVFGAPVAHEDDAERAISAALAMQGAIGRLNDDLERRHGLRLALRIGINTGEVVAGLLAGDVQSAYTVVGDTVNTAQRFESAASPGGILVSEITQRLANQAFEFESLPPLTLKGKAEPQPAFRVIRRRLDDFQPGSRPLVGRERELAWLRGVVDEVEAGRGRVVMLSGEAGVGKTRLANEMRTGLSLLVEHVRVRCVSFEDNTPYALIGRLVRGLLHVPVGSDAATAHGVILSSFVDLRQPVDETTVALLLDILGYGEHTSFDPEVTRRVLVTILQLLVRRLCARAPLVLVAEDLQWVDQASAAVLSDVIKEVPQRRCLLLISARSGWNPPWPCERLDLEALREVGARDLIESAFGEPVDDALAEAILHRTGGNPFFIEEVVRDLNGSGALSHQDGRLAWAGDMAARVPETVQELLAARLDRLPPSSRHVLEPAAVCGRTFWLKVLERLVPDVSLQQDLGVLEDEEVVAPRAFTPELVYAFRHTLIQEVAYQRQLQSHRRVIHGAVANVLEDLYAGRVDEIVDQLAFHYGRSEYSEKAADYLVRAGDRARRLFANEEAARYYNHALELVTDSAVRRSALEGLGEVQALSGELSAARDSFQQALTLAEGDDNLVDQARVQRKIAVTFVRAGDYQGATAWLDRALETVGTLTDPEVGAIWLDRTQVAWRQGKYDEAIQSGSEAIAHAERAGSVGGLADGYKHLGTAHVLKGDRQTGAEHYRRALALYDTLGDLPGLMNVRNNLGIVYRREARWADALAEQQLALDLARRVGDAWSIGMALANIAETLRGQGDFEQALATNEEALRVWTQAGYAVGVATVNMNIGVLNTEYGHTQAAREALQRSLLQWEQLDSRLFLPELYRTLAKVEQERDPELALEWAQRSLEVAREIKARDEEGAALQVLGSVHLVRGDLPTARQALEEAVNILRSTGSQLELARSLHLLADVSSRGGEDRDEVLRLADEALTLFTNVGATREVGRVRALLRD